MKNLLILAGGVAIAATIGMSNLAAADGFSASPLAPDQSVTFTMTPVSITQNSALVIVSGNSVSCSNLSAGHTDNSYLRRFDLDGMYGFGGPFTVSSVDVGMEMVSNPIGAPQPLSVRLYTIPNALPLLFGNLTLIGTANLNVLPQSLTMLHVPVAGLVANPLTHDLVVEVFTPNGQAFGNFIWVGSNALPETAPTYLAAADCGVPQPTPVAALGVGNMHWVLVVNGNEEPTAAANVSFGKLKAMYR